MRPQHFPRVLVVSPVQFNQETGSGVTMGNLFRGWPKDRLAQIHSDRSNKADTSICNRYLYFSGTSLPCLSASPRSWWRLTRKMASFVLGRSESFGYWAHTEKAVQWARSYSPDVIYARALDYFPFYWWFPRQLAGCLGIPYVMRILDDWPGRYENQRDLSARLIWKACLRRNLAELFHGSAANLGISSEMCELYQKRYGARFTCFHNCVDINDWSNIRISYDYEGVFRIVYCGTVSEYKELYSLIDLRDVIVALRKQGILVELVIYGPKYYAQVVENYLAYPPAVIYGGFFPPERKSDILSSADMLVLPINFDKRSLAYVGLSFQTNIPEFMASGTPVLVYGPRTSPNVRYAIEGQWAVVVDQKDKEKLKNAVLRLMQEQSLRSTLGRRAKEQAFREHDARKIRDQFRVLLCGVARENSNSW